MNIRRLVLVRSSFFCCLPPRSSHLFISSQQSLIFGTWRMQESNSGHQFHGSGGTGRSCERESDPLLLISSPTTRRETFWHRAGKKEKTCRMLRMWVHVEANEVTGGERGGRLVSLPPTAESQKQQLPANDCDLLSSMIHHKNTISQVIKEALPIWDAVYC